MERERNNPVGEDESSELLKGEDIDRFYTVGNWNNNETIGITANKKNFRLRVGELNKIKDLIRFKIDLASDSNDGRRTNNYLEIVEHLKLTKAKKIMRLYIEGQLEMYKDILGEDEDFDSNTLSGLTVQDLAEAYNLVKIKLL